MDEIAFAWELLEVVRKSYIILTLLLGAWKRFFLLYVTNPFILNLHVLF